MLYRTYLNNPATAYQVELAETRLGIKLPNSYKSFLLCSNGFSHISPFMNHILPVEEVDWLYNTDREWVAMHQGDYWEFEISDDEYLVYGKEQRSDQTFRPKYLKKSLKICDWCDGTIILLNPEIIHDGEWEVIDYATWNTGATRHRSFLEFLIHTHQSNSSLRTE